MIQVVQHNLDLSFLKDGYADFISRWTAEEEGEFNDQRFHASGLGLCQRKAVASRQGFTHRPFTEEKLAEFAEANFIHAGMTQYWMKSGTAIAREQRFDDLPWSMHTGRHQLRLCSPFPGWSGKFDALVHRPEWCGASCGKTSEQLAGVWDAMVRLYNAQDLDWGIYRDEIRRHLIMPCSLKTVAPAGLRHYVNGPKLHNVWQDSFYVAAANLTYGLNWEHILIMYRARGGAGKPFFFVVRALDPTELIEQYDDAWNDWEEDQMLPDVLDLEASFETDKTYGEVVRLSVSWQCGYCNYNGWNGDGGFCCQPKTTKNQGSDRVAVVKDDRIIICEDWCDAGGHDPAHVADLVHELADREGRDPASIGMTKTSRTLK